MNNKYLKTKTYDSIKYREAWCRRRGPAPPRTAPRRAMLAHQPRASTIFVWGIVEIFSQKYSKSESFTGVGGTPRAAPIEQHNED